MDLKDSLIAGYNMELSQKVKKDEEYNLNQFNKWMKNEVEKLKKHFELLFGEDFTYEISYRQNPDMQIGYRWQPYIEVPELRAVFKLNSLVLYMLPDITFSEEDLPEEWWENPLNKNFPKNIKATSKYNVGKGLAEWEKADWTIYDWPEELPEEESWVEEPVEDKFKVCAAYELSTLHNQGKRFIIHGVGLCDEWGEGWFIEFLND